MPSTSQGRSDFPACDMSLLSVPDGLADGLADPHQQTRINAIPLRTSFYRNRIGIVIVVIVAVSLAVITGAAVGVSRRQTTRPDVAVPINYSMAGQLTTSSLDNLTSDTATRSTQSSSSKSSLSPATSDSKGGGADPTSSESPSSTTSFT